MKKYKLDIVDFYSPSEDVVGYGTKGHHDFEAVKQAVIDGNHDEYNGILKDLINNGHVIHTWHKVIPSKDISVEVKAGVKGAVPYTVWILK